MLVGLSNLFFGVIEIPRCSSVTELSDRYLTHSTTTAVQAAFEAHDPDVLVCSTYEIVPTLHEMATVAGVDDFSLSRWPDVDY